MYRAIPLVQNEHLPIKILFILAYTTDQQVLTVGPVVLSYPVKEEERL